MGKSALALELAERLDGELISADALQVYRGFDLGTAKPSVREQERVPHHLIDILDPHERYSAAAFARDARRAIAEVEGRGRLPIVVGGSGLYLRALIEGISPIPRVSEEVRPRLEQRLEEEGLATLRDQLRQLDPQTAHKTAETDSQRTLRALEVALSTGRPLSWWIAQRPYGSNPLAAAKIGLTIPRDVLYDRIACRASQMLAEGWVKEVSALLSSGLSPTLPAFQAIGYKQIVRHIREGWALELATENTIRATRAYAKRQLTWFRADSAVDWYGAQEPQRNTRILNHLQQLGIGGAQNA